MSFFARNVDQGPPRLQACPVCTYVLCICGVRNGHKLECRYRRTVLAEVPIVECTAHQVAACTTCASCDCGGMQAKPAPATKKRRAA